MLHYDIANVRQTNHRRGAPHNQAMYVRTMKAFLEAIWQGPAPPNERFHLQRGYYGFIQDGGKMGFKRSLQFPFMEHIKENTTPQKRKVESGDEDADKLEDDEDVDEDDDEEVKPRLLKDLMKMVFNEASLTQWKNRAKGPMKARQTVHAHTFQSHRFQLPEIPMEFHSGSNLGDSIQEIKLDFEDLWKVPCGVKYEMLGAHLVKEQHPTEAPIPAEEMVPVCSKSMPVNVYRDIIRGFRTKKVFCGSVTNEHLLEASLLEGANFFGVCWSELHVTMLYELVVKKIRTLMAIPKNVFHNLRYCADLAKLGPSGHKTVPKPDPQAKPKPRQVDHGTSALPDVWSEGGSDFDPLKELDDGEE